MFLLDIPTPEQVRDLHDSSRPIYWVMKIAKIIIGKLVGDLKKPISVDLQNDCIAMDKIGINQKEVILNLVLLFEKYGWKCDFSRSHTFTLQPAK